MTTAVPHAKHLLKQLCQLAPHLEVRLIQWDFKYGMRTQTAALNHCYHALGKRSDFFLNFDIDKYLVYINRENLADYLQTKVIKQLSCIRIPGQAIPMIQNPNHAPTTLERVTNIIFQNQYNGFSNLKTIYYYSENVYIGIHINEKLYSLNDVKNGCKQKQKYALWAHIFFKITVRKYWEEFIGLSCRIIWGCRFYPYRPYFNHYGGLTTKHHKTGWRGSFPESSSPIAYDPKIHCKDERMRLMLKQASLPPDSDSTH